VTVVTWYIYPRVQSPKWCPTKVMSLKDFGCDLKTQPRYILIKVFIVTTILGCHFKMSCTFLYMELTNSFAWIFEIQSFLNKSYVCHQPPINFLGSNVPMNNIKKLHCGWTWHKTHVLHPNLSSNEFGVVFCAHCKNLPKKKGSHDLSTLHSHFHAKSFILRFYIFTNVGVFIFKKYLRNGFTLYTLLFATKSNFKQGMWIYKEPS
jgi:hypothetical protein